MAWDSPVRLRSAPLPLAPPPDGPEGPGAPAVLTEARELGLIDEVTHLTLWTVYVAGLTSAQAARALGSTPEAIRWRCSHALRRLARSADVLAA